MYVKLFVTFIRFSRSLSFFLRFFYFIPINKPFSQVKAEASYFSIFIMRLPVFTDNLKFMNHFFRRTYFDVCASAGARVIKSQEHKLSASTGKIVKGYDPNILHIVLILKQKYTNWNFQYGRISSIDVRKCDLYVSGFNDDFVD